MTEGAVGYRRFGIVSGQKAMAVLSPADGDVPLFGAVVQNHDHIQTWGWSVKMAWSGSPGINPEETMQVSWAGMFSAKFVSQRRFRTEIWLPLCLCVKSGT